MRKRKILGWMVALALMPHTAQASVLSQTCDFMVGLAEWLIMVAYVVSAMSLVRFAFGATMGRFPAPNFLVWIVGVFVVGAVPGIMNFLTSATGQTLFAWAGPGLGFTCP